MIVSIQQMMRKEWSVQIVHCYREANRVIDRMANLAHDPEVKEEGMRIYQDPPTCCRAELAADMKGVSFPRMSAA